MRAWRSIAVLTLAAAACTTVGDGASLGQGTGAAAPVPQAMADPHAWRLVWADEFDGTEIDRTRWGFDVDCWGGGNAERQCYTARPQNAFVSDGTLKIVARQETSEGPALPPRLDNALPPAERGQLKTQPFTSARLTTLGKASWTYGRIEVRARAPEGQGAWAAVWMLPTEDFYGGWAASGEIDIMEAVNIGAACAECPDGRENNIFGTIHFGGAWPRNRYTGKRTDLPPSDDGFHVYAIEWREGEIKWFVDDKHYLTLTSADWRSDTMPADLPPQAPFDRPFYLIMNLAIGGHLAEDRNERGVSSTGFPKTMEVDWVRVFEAVEPTGVR